MICVNKSRAHKVEPRSGDSACGMNRKPFLHVWSLVDSFINAE